MHLLNKIKNNLKYLLVIVVSFWFILWGISYAEDDLLWDIMEPTYSHDTTIRFGKNSKTVWNTIFGGATEIKVTIQKQIKKDNNGNPICDWTCKEWCKGEQDDEQCNYQYTFVDVELENEPSTIVKITRYFLMFTIAISVTMILYNGLRYIVQTGRWQEWKNLVSNIIYIVVWILIALFSVIIITILQSAWKTINDSTSAKVSLNQDNSVYMTNYTLLS